MIWGTHQERKEKVLKIPGGSDGKASVYNAGDLGSIPGYGRFLREGNGNLLQYSCLENLMGGGARCRQLSVGPQTRARLSDFKSRMAFGNSLEN